MEAFSTFSSGISPEPHTSLTVLRTRHERSFVVTCCCPLIDRATVRAVCAILFQQRRHCSHYLPCGLWLRQIFAVVYNYASMLLYSASNKSSLLHPAFLFLLLLITSTAASLYLLLLHKRILNLLAPLHGRDQRQHRTSRHNQPQLPSLLIPVLICAMSAYPTLVTSSPTRRIPTSQSLLHIIQHQIHQLIITLQQPHD